MSVRRRTALSVSLVLGACASIQVSAALAAKLFDDVGTLGVSGLRMAIAALVLLALARPRPTRIPREAWLGVLLYGVAMAAMNVLFYNAVARLPLGVAVTLEFLGPFTVTFLAARGRRDVLLPVLALAGVALVSNPTGGMNAAGAAFGLAAACAFGSYTLLAGRVGAASPGFGGLALSVIVAALVLSPFSVAVAPHVPAGDWPVLAASGVIGVALAFSLTFTAARWTTPRVIGTLFAADPAMAALVGAAALGQRLTLPVLLGIALVALAGAGVSWTAGRPDAVAVEV
jgi:inner membrane transporter RhtA